MAEIGRLQRLLRAFGWRERLLVAGFAAAWGFGALGLVVGVAGFAPFAGLPRGLSAVVLGAGFVAVLWVALRRSVGAWRAAGDIVGQARRVEAVQKGLRGLLVTLSSPTQPASAAIVAREAQRTVDVLIRVPVEAVHPIGTAATTLSASVTWVSLAAASWALGPGLRTRVDWWVQGTPIAAWMTPGPPTAGPAARVGDLVIRSIFPAYTGLPPRVVENGTGDVEGPPGTQVEVTLRTAIAVEEATLRVGEEVLDAQVTGFRSVTGTFRITSEAATWQMLLTSGGTTASSAAFLVTPVPDRAPEVVVDVGTAVMEVPVDSPIGVAWRAGDDFGVVTVVLRVNGVEVVTPLRQVDGHKTSVEGVLTIRPRELGLVPGDEATLEVAARDGDTVSGSHEGRSAPFRIAVLGPGASERLASLRESRIRDLLIPVLAQFLTEPWPPGATGASASAWGALVATRYRPLFDEIAALGDSPRLAPLIQDVVQSATSLVRFSQIAFEPDDLRSASSTAMGEAAALRADAVTDLEDVLLLLELRAQAAALARVERGAKALASTGDSLAGRDAKADLIPALDTVERQASALRRDSLRLESGGLQDLVSRRLMEIDRLTDRAAAAEEIDSRRELTRRLVARIADLNDAVAADLARRRAKDKEAMQQAADVIAELDAIAGEQEVLREEVAGRDESSRAQSSEALVSGWREAEAAARDLKARTVGYADALEAAGRRFYETERAREAAELSQRVVDAVASRDLRGARAVAEAVAVSGEVLGRVARLEAARGQAGPTPEDAQRTTTAAVRVIAALERLSQLSSRAAASSGVGGLSPQQQQLGDRLSAARGGVREVQERLPTAPDGIEQALNQAEMRMDEAERDLGESLALEASGAQGAAASDVTEAADLLRDALASARSAQGEGGGTEGDGGPGSEDGEVAMSPMDLPTLEEFVPPDAYRRALLEAMQGDVPAAWRTARSRYYEELVQP